MADRVRRLAVTALMRVSDGGFSNIVIDSLLSESGFEKRDRAFASALFYGTLERRITLDYVIRRYSKKPLAELSPEVLEILRSGIYQILYMRSVPESAAVNESVNLARDMGQVKASGFVNGILRSFIREGKEKAFGGLKGFEKMSVMYSAPVWLCRMWTQMFGAEKAVAALSASLGTPETYIRANTLRMTPSDVVKALSDEGIEAEELSFPAGCIKTKVSDITSLMSFSEGLYHVQDKSSQMAMDAVGAKPGDRILDVCGAPGGKAFTLAEITGDRGEIISCDVHKKRADLIASGAARLGLGSVKAAVNDGTVYNGGLGTFDRILCDVPCSGLGVIRRKPEIRFKSCDEVKSLPPVQYRIAATSARYLRAGGTMLYSTCTLSDEENKGVVERLINEAGLVPGKLPPEIMPYSEDGFSVTLLPGQTGSDGFYFAVLGKDGSDD